MDLGRAFVWAIRDVVYAANVDRSVEQGRSGAVRAKVWENLAANTEPTSMAVSSARGGLANPIFAKSASKRWMKTMPQGGNFSSEYAGDQRIQCRVGEGGEPFNVGATKLAWLICS